MHYLRMIQYEVKVTIAEELAVEFETYMISKHIPDVLATGRFVSAEFCKSGGGLYRTTYVTQNREMLDAYVSVDAVKLRDAFAREFPHKAKAEREVFEVLKAWDGD